MYRNLHRMVIFSRVVDAGSFTGAAEVLGLSKSVVSHHVSELELHFGVKLLNRTTRKVVPTEFGSQFYLRCKEIDAISRVARDEALSFARQPLGTLTVQAPHAVMGASFTRLLAEFRNAFPGIELRVLAADGPAIGCNPAADICILLGDTDVCGPSVTPLWQHEDILVASHEFIADGEGNIRPETTSSLAYVGLVDDGSKVRRSFRDQHTGMVSELEFRPSVRASTLPAVCALVRAGLGVAVLPRWLVERDALFNDVACILPDMTPTSSMVSAGHRFAENPPRNVTLFLDHIASSRQVTGTNINETGP